MTPNDIYNQGYFSAKKELGTVAELCPFHYSTEQFNIWVNGYNRGKETLLIDQGKGYYRNGNFIDRSRVK